MKNLLFLMILLFLAINASGAMKEGVSFEDEVKVGEIPLILNGIGVRKATLFQVKVYVAGLYLASKENDSQKILQMAGPKKLKMIFVREVEKEKIQNGWTEGLKENAQNFEIIKNELEKFNLAMEDMKENSSIEILFEETGLTLHVNMQEKLKLPSSPFLKDLLSVWLNKAPNEDLKNGLLGFE